MKKITFKLFIAYLIPSVLFLFLVVVPGNLYAQSLKDTLEIKDFKEPSIEEYEQMVFESTQYLLGNPVKETCAEFVSSCKIVSFWMNQDTGYGIPLGGNFFYKLRNDDNQQYFYAVSMVNYLLDQKINHNNILNCLPIEGQRYKDQKDVQEVRLKAAEIFLRFAKKRKNKIKLTARSKPYLKYLKKGTLKDKFLKDLDELPSKKEMNSPFISYITEK